MSRCDCCNKKLNDYEMTLRHVITNEFLNTCLSCLDGLGIPMKGRDELMKNRKKLAKELDSEIFPKDEQHFGDSDEQGS